MFNTPAASYDSAVDIAADLHRARRLAYAADHVAARELLLSLMAPIEQADRDDQILEVFAQLGEIYLERTAFDGVRECLRRMRDTVAIYRAILAGDAPEAAAQVTMPAADITAMCDRYELYAAFLQAGLSAGLGDHDGAAQSVEQMARRVESGPARRVVTRAQVYCATALCDDDQHIRSQPLWQDIIDSVESDSRGGDSGDDGDHLLVQAALAYGRFCIETGRLAEAEPWLRRAGSRAEARGWPLGTARAGLERAAACWSAGDYAATERIVAEVYPVIAEQARAHDVARCWLYTGLTNLAVGNIERADECWANAERQWRELDKPLHIHRILLQRSWIPIFFGRFADAVELIAQARTQLDSSPRSSWLQYARLDDQLGTVYRAEALTELGFDAAGDPDDSWDELEEKHKQSRGIIVEPIGTPAFQRAVAILERAAELKLPAALAVDSVRYTIEDAAARSRWAAKVAAPMLAGSFAVVYEWENTALLAELIEYHSARGAFAPATVAQSADWTTTATEPLPVDDDAALVAAGASWPRRASLTRLRPLPPLQMDPGAPPLLAHYRELAHTRYGRAVTADETPWRTWP